MNYDLGDPDPIRTTKVDLTRLRLGASSFVQREAELTVGRDEMFDGLRLQLHSYVLGQPIAAYDVYHEEPRNWWQHLRQQIGMKAKMRTTVSRVTRYRVYPAADIVLPHGQWGYPVIVEVME